MKTMSWLAVIVLAVFVSGTVYAQGSSAAAEVTGVSAGTAAAQDAAAASAKNTIENQLIKLDRRTIKPPGAVDVKDRIRIPMEVTGRVFAFSRWAGTSVCSAFIKDVSGNDIEINSDKIVCDALGEALAKPVDVTVSGVSGQGKIAVNKMIIHGNATRESMEPVCGDTCHGTAHLREAHFTLADCFGAPTTSEVIHLRTEELCKEIAWATVVDRYMSYTGKEKFTARNRTIELNYVSFMLKDISDPNVQ